MIPHINVIEFLQWVKKNFTFSPKNKGWIKNNSDNNTVYSERLLYNGYLNLIDNKTEKDAESETKS